MQTEIISRFQQRQAHIAVIGLGYVGLPLAVSFAQAGYQVTGIDLDRRKVEAINSGASYIEDVPSETVYNLVFGASEVSAEPALAFAYAGTQETVATATGFRSSNLKSKSQKPKLQATTDFSVLASCDAVSICASTQSTGYSLQYECMLSHGLSIC